MLSIHKLSTDFKRKLSRIPFDFFIAILISLIGFSAFALGWIARGEHTTQPISVQTIDLSSEAGNRVFVASKNSDVFHYRWCGGAQRINAENKVYFTTKAEAEEAGYSPAANCPGL